MIIARIDDTEIRRLFECAEHIVRKGIGRCTEKYSLLDLYKDKVAKLSTAGRTLVLLMNRALREATTAQDVTKRIQSATDFVAIRNKLMRRVKYVDRRVGAISVTSEPQSASSSPPPPSLTEAVAKVYELTVGRRPVHEEIEIWMRHFEGGLPFQQFVVGMMYGEEGKMYADRKRILAGKTDGEFLQYVYEVVLGRGCNAWEMMQWIRHLHSGSMSRSEVLASFFTDAVRYADESVEQAVHDGLTCHVMGTNVLLTLQDWIERRKDLDGIKKNAESSSECHTHRFYIQNEKRFLVSAIASMYKGGEHIERFMDNICSQKGFDDYCELIIVDADSPDNEASVIDRYMKRHPSIRYIHINYRIGIYDAWNVAIKESRGEYLTNTNLDDLRREDSIELQASVLDNLSFVDVVYQDFYYTFDPNLPFDEIARTGYKSMLPVITPYNMLQYNSPHNAPMWRKRLHDELGYFDTNYRSAGDYEFWLRCLAAGKVFYKLNDAHVAYYQNPKGLSTQPGTRGVVEANEILQKYARKLTSQNLIKPFDRFAEETSNGYPPIGFDGDLEDRYAYVQRCLRGLAQRVKYKPHPCSPLTKLLQA